MAQPALAHIDLETPPWPAQGHWAWNDYLRLPDDGQRYEIIEGVLHVSPAPSFDHQLAASEIFAALRSFVRARFLGLVLFAPFDVRLPGVANPVQPDLVFFRKGNTPRSGDKYFEGVPDLVVEVLSPGSSRLDRKVKRAAYAKAGVPEYWLVDPRTRTVTVEVMDSGQAQYTEFGTFKPGDCIRSRLLEGFEADVSALLSPEE